MRNKLLIGLAVAVLGLAGTGCNTTDTANTNANANLSAEATTRLGADNSEITTSTDATGVRTETRVFRNNPRVSKVVVTTQPSGQRTVRVYSATGEEKIVENVGDALEATGEALATAAGWTIDKTREGLNEAGDKLEDAGDQAKKGVNEAGDKLEDAGDKTKKGAKKAGSAIKKAVTP